MKRNIIIKGAGFENKGAQSMCLIAITELHKLYPQHRIIVLTDETKQWKRVYKFNLDCKFVSEKLYYAKIRILFSKLLQIIYKDEKWKDLSDLLESTDKIIDISGYTLSSQWGMKASINYLYEIAVAKYYKVPIYLLPQSFGPFHYSSIWRSKIVYALMKHYMHYPELVCARELEGYELLKPYSKNCLKFCHDMVLFYQGNVKEIIEFKNEREEEKEKTQGHSVVIMPSIRNVTYGQKKNEIVLMYQKIIEELLSRDADICLFAHSSEDKEICRNIKELFCDNKNIYLIDQDLVPEQIEEQLSQFDYAIVSRYHGIVHAYRKSVPCIVFGWAVKYREILKLFGQQNYFCDIREKISEKKVQEVISAMENNYVREKKKITMRRRTVKNQFDFQWIR